MLTDSLARYYMQIKCLPCFIVAKLRTRPKYHKYNGRSAIHTTHLNAVSHNFRNMVNKRICNSSSEHQQCILRCITVTPGYLQEDDSQFLTLVYSCYSFPPLHCGGKCQKHIRYILERHFSSRDWENLQRGKHKTFVKMSALVVGWKCLLNIETQ